ncbi:MAG: carotenoid oxygenase family protein, partial [Polyangiales bacterium]
MSTSTQAPRPAYLSGNYAPIASEIDAGPLEIVGELPRDLHGTYVRIGSNPRFTQRGRYHWFDGDGMIHTVHFEDGRAHYRNRWVRTSAFLAEDKAGASLWTGVTERPDFTNPRGPFKDSATQMWCTTPGNCWHCGGWVENRTACHSPRSQRVGPRASA